MRDARLQYFLTLGMLGTVLPYASVFFRHAGLGKREVGIAFAIYGLAAVISPALVTMLADRFGDSRRWLAAVNLLAGGSLLLLAFAHGATAIFAFWSLFCVTAVPIYPLLNGIHFGQQQRNRNERKVETPFHTVRAFGTVGYVFISLVLFPPLRWGMSLRWVLVSGAVLAALAAIQTFLFEQPGRRAGIHRDRFKNSDCKMPAWHAIKALFSPRFLAFTCAIMLMSMTSQIHSAFYPIYITERIKLAEHWLGQISNVAVVVEAVLIFGCGWLIMQLGVKQLLVWCMLATALRMALLASTNNAWIAVGSQVFHGCLILAIGVLPQTLFNDHADEHFRHSMQGMLVMLTSAGQCLASAAAGFVAAYSLSAVYGCSAILCVIAAGLVACGFRETPGAAGELEANATRGLAEQVVPLVDVVRG